MRTAFLRWEARAASALRLMLGLALILMVLVNVANAAGRYGGLPTLTGADELLVFGMIWIVMIGCILATRARSHLSIDLLPQRLAARSRLLLLGATELVMAAVCAFVAYHSFLFVARVAALGQTSMGLGIPMLVPHSAVLVGFAGTAIAASILAVADLRASFSNGER